MPGVGERDQVAQVFELQIGHLIRYMMPIVFFKSIDRIADRLVRAWSEPRRSRP
jgi:hypothetical protein